MKWLLTKLGWSYQHPGGGGVALVALNGYVRWIDTITKELHERKFVTVEEAKFYVSCICS